MSKAALRERLNQMFPDTEAVTRKIEEVMPEMEQPSAAALVRPIWRKGREFYEIALVTSCDVLEGWIAGIGLLVSVDWFTVDYAEPFMLSLHDQPVSLSGKTFPFVFDDSVKVISVIDEEWVMLAGRHGLDASENPVRCLMKVQKKQKKSEWGTARKSAAGNELQNLPAMDVNDFELEDLRKALLPVLAGTVKNGTVLSAYGSQPVQQCCLRPGRTKREVLTVLPDGSTRKLIRAGKISKLYPCLCPDESGGVVEGFMLAEESKVCYVESVAGGHLRFRVFDVYQGIYSSDPVYPENCDRVCIREVKEIYRLQSTDRGWRYCVEQGKKVTEWSESADGTTRVMGKSRQYYRFDYPFPVSVMPDGIRMAQSEEELERLFDASVFSEFGLMEHIRACGVDLAPDGYLRRCLKRPGLAVLNRIDPEAAALAASLPKDGSRYLAGDNASQVLGVAQDVAERFLEHTCKTIDGKPAFLKFLELPHEMQTLENLKALEYMAELCETRIYFVFRDILGLASIGIAPSDYIKAEGEEARDRKSVETSIFNLARKQQQLARRSVGL